MDNERFLELIDKMEMGTATEAELLELDDVYTKFESKAGFTDHLTDQQKEDYENQLFAKISSKTSSSIPMKKILFTPTVRILVAFILVVGALGTLFLTKTSIKNNAQQAVVRNDIAPGTNKATLILSDGSKISLTDAANGKLANEPDLKITKTKDGQLIYEPSHALTGNAESTHDNRGIAYNTITTPRGGQYRVVLPDGTRAWLNAGSSLTYPISFSKEGRKVQMTGEIYFEVAKVMKNIQRIPFIVVTEKQQVEVLGTHFNINAYPDEPVVKTTLVEGSVKVRPNGSIAQLLKPGQQSLLTKGQMNIQDTDIENALAWKNGLFRFQDDNLKTVMQQLERWYDVDIDYKNMPSLHFNGGVSKNVPISQVLKMLEITGGISFTITGKNVKIKLAK